MLYSHEVRTVPLESHYLLTPEFVKPPRFFDISRAVSHAKKRAESYSSRARFEVVELKTGHTKATYETDGQGDVKSQAFL